MATNKSPVGVWTKLKELPLWFRTHKKSVWVILALIVFVLGGGFAYYKYVYQPSQTASSTTPALQTATVRQGDLVIYASGTGTLTSVNQATLSFSTNGKVKAVNVKVGDLVKVGDELAEIENSNAQVTYDKAKSALRELTSDAAIATAQTGIATAQKNLDSAMGHLEYVISPGVLHWEIEIENTKQKIDNLQKKLQASPTDADLQKQLSTAQAYLSFAQDRLKDAWYYYDHEYVKQNFTVGRKGVKYVAPPTSAEILAARAAVTSAKAALKEANYLYAALTGGDVPKNATGSGLTALQQAQIDLASAQDTLNGSKIISPISGTVMSVGIHDNDTVSSSTTVITVADLTQLTLDSYLDPSDWDNVKIGNDVEVTFDNLPNTKFTAKVIQVDPGLSTQNNTNVIHAVVKLDATATPITLPLGSSAAVDVIGGQARNAILVPVDALHQAGDGYTVFVMENGKLRLHVVTIGVKDLTYAEVKSGLKAGDIVSTGITKTSSSQTSTP